MNKTGTTGKPVKTDKLPDHVAARMGRALDNALLIPLKSISAKGANIRKEITRESIAELTDSIKRNGMLEPVIVTRKANGLGYDLVTGYRRFTAATSAGLEAIPALLIELSPEERTRIQLAENIHHENLTALEEGDAFRELANQPNHSAKDVAVQFGKSERYVMHRLRIAALPDAVKKNIRDGVLTLGAAIEVAKLPGGDNQLAAGKILAGWGSADNPVSARTAREKIESEFMLRIDSAPFNVRDESLVAAAGACMQCAKRSGAQPLLFPEAKGDDRCVDASCWRAKIKANWTKQKAAAKAQGITVIDTDSKERSEIFITGGASVDMTSQWIDVDELCPGDAAKRTYAQVMAEQRSDIPRSIVSNEAGKVFEVAKRADVTNLLRRVGLLEKRVIPSGAEGAKSAKQIEEEAREKERKTIERAQIMCLMGAIDTTIVNLPGKSVANESAFWLAVVEFLIETALTDQLKFFCLRRGLIGDDKSNPIYANKIHDAAQAVIDKKGDESVKVSKLVSIAVELMIARRMFEGVKVAREWAGICGVDADKALKALAVKQSAEAKAKRDKDARKSGKVVVVKPADKPKEKKAKASK